MSTAQEIVTEVRGELNDEDTSDLRWSDADMLVYVNAGQREIVTLLPEANTIEAITTVNTDNQSRHTIPSDGIKFIKVSSNYDVTNTVRGPMLRRMDIDALEGAFEFWGMIPIREWPRVPNFEDIHTEVRYENFAHDPREPTIFYMYPGNVTNNFSIQLVYAQLPADLTGLGDTFLLDDQYQNAMVEYVLYRCLSRDGRYGPGTSARKELLNNFRQVLGLEVQQAERVGPGASSPPEGP
jgi:hypothetical protein